MTEYSLSLIKTLTSKDSFPSFSFRYPAITFDIFHQDEEICKIKIVEPLLDSSFTINKTINFIDALILLNDLQISKYLNITDTSILDYDSYSIKTLNLKDSSISNHEYYNINKLNISDKFKFSIHSYLSSHLIFDDETKIDNTFFDKENLEISKDFAFVTGKILSISKVINISDEIQLDYLYYLINELTLEETIDIVATYLGVPTKCFTTAIKKFGLETTLKKITMDTEIKNKCD